MLSSAVRSIDLANTVCMIGVKREARGADGIVEVVDERLGLGAAPVRPAAHIRSMVAVAPRCVEVCAARARRSSRGKAGASRSEAQRSRTRVVSVAGLEARRCSVRRSESPPRVRGPRGHTPSTVANRESCSDAWRRRRSALGVRTGRSSRRSRRREIHSGMRVRTGAVGVVFVARGGPIRCARSRGRRVRRRATS